MKTLAQVRMPSAMREALERARAAGGSEEEMELEERRGWWRRRVALLPQALVACGVPEGLLDARDEACPSETARALIWQAAEGGSWLLTSTRNGVGKSRWSVCVLRHRLKEAIRKQCLEENLDIYRGDVEAGVPDFHHGHLWTRLSWVVEKISTAIHDRASTAAVLDSLRSASWLCLDDLASRVTDFGAHALFELIDHRLERNLPTVLTCDVSLDRLHAALGDQGNRVASRLQRYSVIDSWPESDGRTA